MDIAIIFSFGDLKLVGLQKKNGSTFKAYYNGVFQEVVSSHETNLDLASTSVAEQLMGIVL